MGGQTFVGMITKNLTDTNTRVDELLEQLLDRQNLNVAYVQVIGNRGAGGIDKMGVESLGDYLREHNEKLLTSIKPGNYSPAPLRRVEIPKENGSKRMLGIPTEVDRLIQQGISHSTNLNSVPTAMVFVRVATRTKRLSNARNTFNRGISIP